MTAHAPYDLGILSLFFLSVDLRPNAPSIRVLLTLSIYILLACLAQDRPFLFRAGFCFSLSLCAWFRLFNTILLCPWLFGVWPVSICIHYSSQDKPPCTHGANAISLLLTSFETPYSRAHNAMFELTPRSIKPQKKSPRSTLSAVYPMLPTNLLNKTP